MDKVQKIREEVEKLKLCTMDEHMKFYSESAEAEYYALCKVEEIIESLQEEPVSSIWHNASEKSNEPENVVIINPFDNTGEVLTKCVDVYQGHIWAYTSELLKLYNLCKVGKNLQEEPVSDELELTWEDIKDILNIYEEVIDMDFCEDIYGEVLKRFKDFKERKDR